LARGSGDVVTGNNGGIWSDRDGSLALLLRKGDSIPSSDPSESVLLDLIGDSIINQHGRFAMAGRMRSDGETLDFSRDSAIWAEQDSGLEIIAREGDQAPGTNAGAVFDDMGSTSFVFNANGQVAFLGELEIGVGGVTFNTREGIWATNVKGELELITRVGDLLEVATGDFREIRDLHFVAGSGFPDNSTGNQDGRPSGFNNKGLLTFAAEFTDFTSGVFVSSQVLVPEPSALVLLMSGAVVMVSRLRPSLAIASPAGKFEVL